MSQRTIDYTRYYENFHRDTPEYRQGQIQFYTQLLSKYLPTNRDARVLDIGCGTGFVISTLLSLGFKDVSGIDVDAGQVGKCQKQNLDVTLVADTPEYLSHRKNSYDLIILLDVLEHVPVSAQLDFLGAIFDALAPGGKLICTVPNASSTLGGRWRYGDWTHHSSFTELSLDFILFNAGFRHIEFGIMEFMHYPGRRLMPDAQTLRWWRFKFFRWIRYQQLVAELGRGQADKIPLSLNLLATAIHPK